MTPLTQTELALLALEGVRILDVDHTYRTRLNVVIRGDCELIWAFVGVVAGFGIKIEDAGYILDRGVSGDPITAILSFWEGPFRGASLHVPTPDTPVVFSPGETFVHMDDPAELEEIIPALAL